MHVFPPTPLSPAPAGDSLRRALCAAAEEETVSVRNKGYERRSQMAERWYERERERVPRTDGTRIFVERILGSIRADTFNTTIEICLPMTMRTVQP